MSQPKAAREPLKVQAFEMACLACGGSEHQKLAANRVNNIFPLLECRECGLIRMAELPLPKNEVAVDTNPVLETFTPFLEWLKTQFILKPEIRRTRRQLKGKGPVLDVGCGTGWATSLWKSYGGMEVHGLEFQPAWAEMATKRFGFPVLKGRFEDINLGDHLYELVILRHVLEHFPDPLRVLNKVYRILKPGGYGLIMVPNGAGFGRRIFKGYWIWAPPEHIYTFSPGSLGRLLKRSGFGDIRTLHSPSPMLLAASLYNWLACRGKPGLAKRFHPGSLISNGLLLPLSIAGKIFGRGDVITVLARKEEI